MKELEVFEKFRKWYPGTKRGCLTEFNDFKRKHKDYKEVLQLLLPALSNQLDWHNDKVEAGVFVPMWKNLKTWLNQRCWEEEPPEIQVKPQQNRYGKQEYTKYDFERQARLLNDG